MSFEKRPEATAEFASSEPLDIADGSVTLDSGVAPYCLADIEVPLLDDEILEDLDPYANQRVVVTASAAMDGSDEREFDLVMTARTVSHDGRSVSLELASDEAILQRYADVTESIEAFTHQTSLRAVINMVLAEAIPGAALQPGSLDADVTAYWSVTNFIPNPSGQINGAHWVTGDGASGMAAVTMTSPLPPSGGNRAIGWTASAGNSNGIAAQNAGSYRVTPGRSYVFAFVVCTSASARTVRAAIQWWSTNGTVFSSEVFGDTITATNTTFRRAYVIATAPPGVTNAFPYVRTVSNTGGEAYYAAEAMLYEGDRLVPFFHGDTTDTAQYTYAWANTAHASTSTRTPVVERPPETFTWEAGVTAWDFLSPIVATTGYRLWCDEQRRWWLTDPSEYSLPGRVVAQVSNTSRGADSIDSLSPLYATGVVLVYKWTDAQGVAQRAVDSAGSGPYVVREDIDRPYPGPGRAAARLAKLSTQGRTQDVTVGADYNVTPAMEVGISLPGTYDQVGTLTRVAWRLKTGVMDLGSAGLVEIPPGAIDLLTGTIDSLVGTIDSL